MTAIRCGRLPISHGVQFENPRRLRKHRGRGHANAIQDLPGQDDFSRRPCWLRRVLRMGVQRNHPIPLLRFEPRDGHRFSWLAMLGLELRDDDQR